MDHPVTASSAWTDDDMSAVRSREHLARLGDVLEAIAIEALGRETPRTIGAIEVRRIRAVIGDPVAAAADAAIDLLAADLASARAGDWPALRSRSDDERRRVELGLD